MPTPPMPTVSGTRLVLCLAAGVPALVVVATLVLVPVAMFMLAAGAGDIVVPPEDPPAVDDRAAAIGARGEIASRILRIFFDTWRCAGTFPPGV